MPGVNRQLIKAVATYITRIFDIFGQILTEEALEEILLMPFHSSLAEFRGNVRGLASEVKAGNILAECDTLRDVVLPNLGVRLEDKEGEPPVIKQVPVTAHVIPDLTHLVMFSPNFLTVLFQDCKLDIVTATEDTKDTSASPSSRT